MEPGALHDPAACPARSQYVRVRAIWEDIEAPPVRCLSATEVLEHLGDDRHVWPVDGMPKRLELIGVCPAGMVASIHVPNLRDAWDLLSMEGLAEQFGVMPEPGGLNDQDPRLLEAFSVIRSARNQVQERRIREAENRAKGGG